MRVLLVSTLDSKQPFGAFTRPFYLGMYLAKWFEVCQVGVDCSSVHYCDAISVGDRTLRAYIRTLKSAIAQFQPDIIYAQETLPGIAALIAAKNRKVVFDFHTLSAFEYWSRISSASNRLREVKQFIKTYIAQGCLIAANKLIIAASRDTIDMVPKWYHYKPAMQFVGNGVPEDLVHAPISAIDDPYQSLRPKQIVVTVAPKSIGYEFPSNDMSVEMTIDIAKRLQNSSIHFVVIGRDSAEHKAPSNVTFTGFLPSREDFVAHVAHADIGLLPFPKEAVAGGARNKALDYLACKTLVVSTPEGLRGLEDFQNQKHLLMTGYDVDEIATTISEVCANRDRYSPLVEASHQFVRSHYSWSAMAERVGALLRREVAA
jgi:glycosyltransferase involved in cell wall biosynthesis